MPLAVRLANLSSRSFGKPGHVEEPAGLGLGLGGWPEFVAVDLEPDRPVTGGNLSLIVARLGSTTVSIGASANTASTKEIYLRMPGNSAVAARPGKRLETW